MAPEDAAAAAAAAAAIRELSEGLEFAGSLGSRLPAADPEAAKLFEGLMGALSRALSALQPGESGQGKAGSPSGDRKSEASGGKRKVGPAKDRRGGCRRRSQPSSWTRITSTKMEDGFSWRKYGQKEIHSAKYPRSYFRCTHKHDQGCQATRQVQKSEENPSLFIITYMGVHSCRDPTKVPALAQPTDPRLISFSSTLAREPHKRADYDEDVLSIPTPGTSSSDYNLVLLPDLPAAGRLAVDHGDVTSGFHASGPGFVDDDMGFSPAFEFADFNFGFGEDDDDQLLLMGRDPPGPPS